MRIKFFGLGISPSIGIKNRPVLLTYHIRFLRVIIIAYIIYGPVAQWIEQFRPKEEVVRSTRTRVTIFLLRNFSHTRRILVAPRAEDFVVYTIEI